MRYGPDYLEEVQLRDGSHIVLRPIRAGDEELLREGFSKLSAVSRYRRFLMAKSGLSDDELRHLTATDGWDHLAIGAGRFAGDSGDSGDSDERTHKLISPTIGVADAALSHPISTPA